MSLDDMLDAVQNEYCVDELDELDEVMEAPTIAPVNPDASPVERMDPRLKLLSYSFQTLLHTCPRKYQLTRLRATQDEQDPFASMNQNVTFAFGHIVGSGVQDILSGTSQERTIFNMFLAWHADLFDINEKQLKSFWHAVAAIQRFVHLRNSGFLDEYELVWHEGKPAVELSFMINMPDGFKMRGSVDIVLRHKETGKILVVDCKTTSSPTVAPATYKNSSQTLGYSVILDILFPELSSYEVMYLVYKTKGMEYEVLNFTKSHTQRAMWIQELLLDVECLKMYETAGVYPMYGQNCYEYFRECEYLQVCTLSTKALTTPQSMNDNSETNSTYTGVYTITLSLLDLINGQLAKNALQNQGQDSEGNGMEHMINYNPDEDTLL